MITTALNAEYQKAFPSKFVTQRDRVTPLHCITCNTVLVMGQAATATNDFTNWHSYCAACAADFAPQIHGLLARVTEMGVTIDGPTTEAIRAYLTNDCYATFYAAKVLLMAARAEAGKAAKAAQVAEQIAALGEDEQYVGLTMFATYGPKRDLDFATSLLRQWEAKGSLSERQMVYVAKFAVRGHKLALDAEPDPDVEPGLYTDGTIVRRVYERSNRLVCRSYNGTVFAAEMGGVRKVHAGLVDGTIRLLTGDEARAYGRQHSRCFNCLSIGRPGELSDDRSIAAGYGERCAQIHGWWYPTVEEAAAILRPQS